MRIHNNVIPCMIYILLLSLLQSFSYATPNDNYIVYLGTHSHHAERRLLAEPEDVTRSHHDLLASVSKSGDSSKKLIYSYNKVFNAFAATLNEQEADELARHPDVISVFISQSVVLHTTHSWEFLGLKNDNKHAHKSMSLWDQANFGEDIIIANIDSGVWPESKSFSDEGMGAIPVRFKGKCESGNDPKFKCNKKLIGARYFNKGAMAMMKEGGPALNLTVASPRDMFGHGTHTLSTAGGGFVDETNLAGFANGTAKGGAPKARVVAYKAMWPSSEGAVSMAIDILAAFEAAILDGVDIINYSAGELQISKHFEGVDHIATFHAMKNGIPVISAAGNSGPEPTSVRNLDPWVLTVAATTMDREFSNFVTLGNNLKLKASQFYSKFNIDNKSHPLISAADASVTGAKADDALQCLKGSLDPAKVKGKIVVCLLDGQNPNGLVRSQKGIVAAEAGAIGMIMANSKSVGLILSTDDQNYIPVSHLTYKDGQAVYNYIKSTRTPVASFSPATTITGVKPSPIAAAFSSRGPNLLTPSILKPDVTAPGVAILAAYSDAAGYVYYLSSGTSMACPHVAGVAALVKKMHPGWSPSAIRSAIITTASPLDNTGSRIRDYDMVREATPFDIGSGLVAPNLATDPGLVYDMNHEDYLLFLCAHHYNNTIMQKFSAHHSFSCPKSHNILNFNYPSISIPEFSGNVVVTRKLKNVGPPGTYVARIEAPPGVSIVVEPKTMIFSAVGQVIEYKLTFTSRLDLIPKDYVFGSLIWSDGKHVVRSPIVVKGVVKGRAIGKVKSKPHV